jgi:TolA-binding protein
LLIAALLNSACSASKPNTRPPARRAVRETVAAKDSELERQVAELELRLLEKEAQVEELQSRLDDTRTEVVRTMAKLQTVASRAEAASGMAEAEIALQSLKSSAGPQGPEVAQVAKLVRESSGEFNKQNYGGALYLAGQAKALAGGSRGRIAGGNGGASRHGETPFATPIRLRSTGRGNVREGPGTKYDVAFSLDSGSPLTGYSYVDEWIRVSDDSGRSGWIFRSLVARR